MKKIISLVSLSFILSISMVASAEEDNLELTQTPDEAAPLTAPSAVEASEETVIPAEESAEVQDASADLAVESSEDFQ